MSEFRVFLTILTVFGVLLPFLAVQGFAAHEALDMLFDSTDGDVGLYFKRINGPVGVDYRASEPFEPASAIKVLIHVHIMRQVQVNPAVNLFDLIPWFGDVTKYTGLNYNPGGSDCYSDNTVVESDTLKQSLRYMMENSDNALTQALRDYFGDASINATRTMLGMYDTVLDHSIGCGGEAVSNHNQLTLADVGKLHEEVATGFLGPIVRADFYDLMINNGAPENFDEIVNEEAAKQGKIQLADDFRNAISFAWKGGSYGLAVGQYRSIAGWIKFPFDFGSSYREYVFGAFVDGASTLDEMSTGEDLSIGAVASEMMREMIRGALWTWKVGGILAPDLGGGIDSLKAYLVDLSPTIPLYGQINSAIGSLEDAGNELRRPVPDMMTVMGHFRDAVGNFDYAVANGMLDIERGYREAKMITGLARTRALNIIGVALATGNNRDFTNIMGMADTAIQSGDRFLNFPTTSFPGNFYTALDNYEDAIAYAESTIPVRRIVDEPKRPL